MWPQEDVEVADRKGHCRCVRAVVCVQMCYQHWRSQLFLMLQTLLMVLEKWAVRLCNQERAFKIHSQSLIPLGWFFSV